MTSTPAREVMIATLFEHQTGHKLADVSSNPAFDALAKLAALSDRRLATAHRRAEVSRRPIAGRLGKVGRPGKNYGETLDLFEGMRNHLQEALPPEVRISDVALLTHINAAIVGMTPDGNVVMKDPTDEDVERILKATRGRALAVRRHVKTVAAAFSRERSKRKQR